jgi:hypothetical protein
MHASLPDDSADCGTDDHIVYREPGGDYRGHEHDVELGGDRCYERERESGDVRVDFSERNNVHESGGDDNLYADGDKYFRIGNGDSDGDGDQAEPADDQFIHSEPHGNLAGRCEHAELDDVGRDDPLDQSGRNYGERGERIDTGEPGGDCHLCLDSDECRGLGDGVSDGNGIDTDHTGDQLLLGQPAEHYHGREQHAELGNDGRDERADCAGRVQLDVNHRVDDGESDDDDDLYAYCGKRCGDGNRDGDGDCDSVRRDAFDYDDNVPRRNAEHGVRGLHDHSERRHAAVFLQREYEHKLSSTP